MNAAHWTSLMLWLAAETAALMGLAALLQKRVISPRARRTIWRAALTTVALVWLVEISGVRDKIPGWDLPQHRYAITAVLLPNSSPQVNQNDGTAAKIPPTLPPQHDTVKWPAWIWLAGSTLLLTRFGLARVWLALRRHTAGAADQEAVRSIMRLKTALELRRVQAEVWSNLRSPVAFGIFTPTIALPPDFSARFSAAEREAVLAHEIAHLAAHDPFWLMVSDVVTALTWWHPLTWWARGQLQSANEAAADEASTLIPEGPPALAECLVRLGHELTAPNPARALGIGGSGPRSQLAGRVERLLRKPPAWRPSSWWLRCAPPVSAIFVASASAILPIQTGLSGSIWTMLTPSVASTPNQVAGTNAVPAAPKFPNSVPLALRQRTRTNSPSSATQIPPIGGSNSAPMVWLQIQVLIVNEHSADDIGLDWIFGVAPANNPVLEVSHDWTALATAPVSHPENLVIDRLRIDGQSAILQQAQFAALRARIRNKDEHFASAPSIMTRSGRETCVGVQDFQAIVTGVKVIDASPTNSESINYLTDQMGFGLAVDVIPTLKDDGKWRLTVRASDTAFLDYDKLADDPSAVPDYPRRPVPWQTPRPHFRAVETDADEAVTWNQTLALRGPLWTETSKTKARFLSPAKTKTVRQRLYVFVTPVHSPPKPEK